METSGKVEDWWSNLRFPVPSIVDLAKALIFFITSIRSGLFISLCQTGRVELRMISPPPVLHFSVPLIIHNVLKR